MQPLSQFTASELGDTSLSESGVFMLDVIGPSRQSEKDALPLHLSEADRVLKTAAKSNESPPSDLLHRTLMRCRR